MKKLITAIAAMSMIATPAFADGRGAGGRAHGGFERHEHRDRGDWVLPLFGGLVIGGIITDTLHTNDRPVYETPPQRLYICQNEYVRDLYGNYVLDQFGRAILQQRCWYQ